MERFNALGRGAQIMLVGSVLLLIDMFLSWQSVEVADVEVASASGWRGVGVVLGLLNVVLLAWLIVRLASVNIPLPVSTAMTGALLGVLILIFAIIKILTILGDATTIWAWIGVVLAIAIAFGAFQTVQEAGGVNQLKSEIPNMPSSTKTETAATAPAAPPAAPSAATETAPPPAAPPPVSEQASEPTSEPRSEPGGYSDPADDRENRPS